MYLMGARQCLILSELSLPPVAIHAAALPSVGIGQVGEGEVVRGGDGTVTGAGPLQGAEGAQSPSRRLRR